MDDFLKTALPFLGNALLGPAGAGVAAWVASKLGLEKDDVDSVKASLQGLIGNPETAAKLKELDNQFAIEQLKAGSEIIKAVNQTMQTEAQADHWPTFSWRPWIGFSFGFYINALWLLPMFNVTPARLSVDEVMAIGAILGVTAWFRGKMQADPNINSDNRG